MVSYQLLGYSPIFSLILLAVQAVPLLYFHQNKQISIFLVLGMLILDIILDRKFYKVYKDHYLVIWTIIIHLVLILVTLASTKIYLWCLVAYIVHGIATQTYLSFTSSGKIWISSFNSQLRKNQMLILKRFI